MLNSRVAVRVFHFGRRSPTKTESKEQNEDSNAETLTSTSGRKLPFRIYPTKSIRECQRQQGKVWIRSETGKMLTLRVCEYCGKAYRHKGHYDDHILKHTGEKPYVCTDCGDCFRSSSSLKLHTRVHTGERPYECDICPLNFSSPSNYKRHMNLHAGIRPFICNICGEGFPRKQQLELHIAAHERAIAKKQLLVMESKKHLAKKKKSQQ